MLHVFTAGIGYAKAGKADALDITRMSGRDGLFLAPSWGILRPALDARADAAELIKRAKAGQYDPREAPGDAERIEQEAWDAYEPAFMGPQPEAVPPRYSARGHLSKARRAGLRRGNVVPGSPKKRARRQAIWT